MLWKSLTMLRSMFLMPALGRSSLSSSMISVSLASSWRYSDTMARLQPTGQWHCNVIYIIDKTKLLNLLTIFTCSVFCYVRQNCKFSELWIIIGRFFYHVLQVISSLYTEQALHEINKFYQTPGQASTEYKICSKTFQPKMSPLPDLNTCYNIILIYSSNIFSHIREWDYIRVSGASYKHIHKAHKFDFKCTRKFFWHNFHT